MATSKSSNGLSSFLLFAGSFVLIVSGGLDLTVSSRGNQYGSYFEETSIAAISIRSQGGLKVGLGLGMLGASAAIIVPNALKELMDTKLTGDVKDKQDQEM